MATKNEVTAAALRAGRLSVDEAAALLEGETPRVRLTGRFTPGTKVKLVRVAPGVTGAQAGDVLHTATVDKQSVVEFDRDVEVGWPYFIVGEVDGVERQVRVTGKVPAGSKETVKRPSAAAAKPLAQEPVSGANAGTGDTTPMIGRADEEQLNRRRAAKRVSGREAKAAALKAPKK